MSHLSRVASRHLRNQPRRPRITVLLVVAACVAALAQAVLFAGASHFARALASAAKGSGGDFIALQAPLLDTTTGLGGISGPIPATTWKTVTVAGAAGLPSSGMSAVELTVTAVNPTSSGTITMMRPSECPPSNSP